MMALVSEKHTASAVRSPDTANDVAAVECRPTARLLLIEDDSETAEELTAELADCGFEVEWAANGIEGLDKARSLRPDAMIVDRLLPGMDGLTVIEALRKRSGPHSGAGAERAWRGRRPRTRIADGR